MLVLLGNNLSQSFRDHFNARAADPTSGIEIIPSSIGVFNANHPEGTQEAFAEFWYKAPLSEWEAHKAKLKGQPVVVIQSLSGNSGRHIQELEAIMSTLEEHQAGPVTAFLPYAPFVRQERLDEGRICSRMGKRFPRRVHDGGVSKVATLEVHSRQAEDFYTEAFGAGNALFLSAAGLFADDMKARGFTPQNTVILAPDGADKPDDAGQRRARELATTFHNAAVLSPEQERKLLAKLEKRRTPGAVAGTSETKLTWVSGDVAGKDCVIVDDVGDSLGTAADAADLLLGRGARSVHIYLSHQGGDASRLEKNVLNRYFNDKPAIDRITFTDSCPGIERHIDMLAAMKNDDGSAKYPDVRKRIAVLTTAPLFEAALSKFSP